MTLDVGSKAPDFTLANQDRQPVTLSQLRGRPVVLAFFPAAFSSVCAKELCTFRDSLGRLSALPGGTEVLGISVDFNDANKAWGEKIGLKYPLLTDVRRAMSRAYGVLNDDPAMAQDSKRIPAYLRAKRSWFVVDKEGVIRYARVTDPRGLIPNDEILEVLAKLK